MLLSIYLVISLIAGLTVLHEFWIDRKNPLYLGEIFWAIFVCTCPVLNVFRIILYLSDSEIQIHKGTK